MKVINKEHITPEVIKFDLYDTILNTTIHVEGHYYQQDNDEKKLGCIAIPFIMYNDKLYLGDVGDRHDDLFSKHFDELNNDSLEIVKDNNKYICKHIRIQKCFAQQGRLFVYNNLNGDSWCIITSWRNNMDEKVFNLIKKENLANNYLYIYKRFIVNFL